MKSIPSKINYENQRKGRLLVKKETSKRTNGSIVWECECDCGNFCYISSKALASGTSSCGCLHQDYLHSNHRGVRENISDKQFGLLTAQYPLEKSGSDGSIVWHCLCECGNEVDVNGSNLRSLNTLSCGCINYSIGEKNIANILKKNLVCFEREYKFTDLYDKDNSKLLRFDFALTKDGKVIRLIEFDGAQHYYEHNFDSKQPVESLKERVYRDGLKNNYCNKKNIPLIRIPYWERDKITLEMLLGNQYLIS